jgi:hypothetical protein
MYGELGGRPNLHLFDCNMFFESTFQSIGNKINLSDPYERDWGLGENWADA